VARTTYATIDMLCAHRSVKQHLRRAREHDTRALWGRLDPDELRERRDGSQQADDIVDLRRQHGHIARLYQQHAGVPANRVDQRERVRSGGDAGGGCE